jgi:enoyl-CoA hydratase/carnithine racemase
MDEPQPSVRRHDSDGVATLTLDRPKQRNALSSGLLAELLGHLRAVDDDHTVHVVVLAAAGPVFSAGHDLRELQEHPEPAFRQALFDRCSEVMLALLGLRQPVLAKVHGVATAAGCQLVATCDLAIAAQSARFATPGVNIGLFCSTPMVALTRAVGRKQAMEMLLTGDMIGADEAARIGLVNRVVADDRLDAEVDALAATIAAKSSAVVAIGKEAFHRQADLPVAEAYRLTGEVMVRNLGLADAEEGIGAFLDKRPPSWSNG